MITGIIGTTQGGTSAVAAVVKSLGVSITGLDRTLDDAGLFATDANHATVAKSRGTDWAWKYPIAYIPHEYPVLKVTDRFIVVWRDPIARSVHHRDLNAPNMPVFNEWFDIVRTYKRVPGPVLHVSYEKLLVKTDETVQMIADFLDIPVTKEALLAVNAQKGYEMTKEVNCGVV